MAGWLSSKLKEAEQFLQQIDQQAAESLGKPEIQKPSDRHGRHGRTKPIADLPYVEKDVLREASARGKIDLGLEAAPSALSKLVKKSDKGPREVNGNARLEVKDSTLYKKKQLPPVIQNAGDSEGNGKDDWTELLASPNVDLLATPALASSVGSSDSGRTGYLKGPSFRTTVNQSKNGGHHRQSDDISLAKNSLAKSSTKESPVTLKISPSTVFSRTGSVDSSKTVLPGRFGDETLPRRLELDLAELVGAETEENSEVLVSATAKDIGMNEDGVDLDQAITERSPESENSMHVSDFFSKENTKEDGVDEARPSEDQPEGPRNLWEHASTSPGLASDSKDNRAEVNQTTILPIDNEHNESGIISHSCLNKPGSPFADTSHGIEKQTSSTQNSLSENGRSAVSDTRLVVEGRDLAAAYAIGNLESSPATQALPASLQLDEESYDSSLMSDGDSDRETDSEDEEDEEMERRKFAHKKRIARRKELTAARAAAAQAAIRERELFVEKLEKEVVILKRILAEREEQQGKEAAELRTSMAEVMHALETEKKLHSSTRMKALAVESQLENQNADLAKSLGALQWEFDEQMSQVLKARNMIDSKEAVKAELERRLAKMRGDLYCEQNGELKLAEKSKDEDSSFEEEQSDLWKKIQQCQIQVKDLEVKIHGLKDTRRVKTEIEQELENRLAQMTDYLIQKQTQVEALATEKATLLIRLEALSTTINEERMVDSSQASRNKLGGRRSSDWDSHYYDMEYGLDRSYDSKSKHSTYELGESSATVSSTGSMPLSPVLRQLNGSFSAGMFYLRKHRWAQAFAMMYIIILHLWVWFVVSKPTQTLSLQEFGLPKNVSELKYGSNVTNLL